MIRVLLNIFYYYNEHGELSRNHKVISDKWKINNNTLSMWYESNLCELPSIDINCQYVPSVIVKILFLISPSCNNNYNENIDLNGNVCVLHTRIKIALYIRTPQFEIQSYFTFEMETK